MADARHSCHIAFGWLSLRNKKPAFFPYSRQQIDEDDIAAVVETLRSDFLTTGPKINEFEEAFAAKLNINHAIVCSNGTAALHMAAAVAKLGPGDTAIVPAITFLATANAVRYTGADVVFADVDPNTGLMTPETLDSALKAEKLTSTRVILPVHLNGQCCDMPAIAERAQKADLLVIEDACHVLAGAYANGKPVGNCAFSNMSVFSAHPVKAIAMGEGGIVTTADPEMATQLRLIRNHGMVRNRAEFTNAEQALAPNGEANPWYYEMQEVGFNYRASDIHCALGLSQLAKLDSFVSAQNKLADHYQERLQALAPIVRPIMRTEYGTPAWHVSVALIDFEKADTDRANVMNVLREKGIGSQVLYMPLYRQPYYERLYGTQRMAGAEQYYARCLCLPLFTDMTSDDIDHIVDTLASALGISARL